MPLDPQSYRAFRETGSWSPYQQGLTKVLLVNDSKLHTDGLTDLSCNSIVGFCIKSIDAPCSKFLFSFSDRSNALST